MKTTLRIPLIFGLICFSYLPTCTLSAQNLSSTRTYTFHSKVYEKERSFRIAVPENAPSGTKYNLLYVLDADYMFDVVASLAIYMQACDYIPPTAVVAVDYDPPGDKFNSIGWNEHTFSLYESGQKFYRYINREIVPFVDFLLPTTGFRTLASHSYTANYLTWYLQDGNPNFHSYLLFAPEPYSGFHTNDSITEFPIGAFPFPAEFQSDPQQQNTIIRIILPETLGYYRWKNRISHQQNYPKFIKSRTAPLENMNTYAANLQEGLINLGFEDVKTEVIPTDYLGVISEGTPIALRSLYEHYWNTDSLERFAYANQIENPIHPAAGQSIWSFFEEVNARQLRLYHQPLRISESSIHAFIRRAQQTADTDTSSLNRLIDFFKEALSSPFPDPDALRCFGEQLRFLGRNKEAIELYERKLSLDIASGRPFDNTVWSCAHPLTYMLCQTGNKERAWELLEQVKSVNPPGTRVAACYQQGLIAARYKYRMCEGIDMLREALQYPDEIKRWVGNTTGASPAVAEMAVDFLVRHADCTDSANEAVSKKPVSSSGTSPYAPTVKSENTTLENRTEPENRKHAVFQEKQDKQGSAFRKKTKDTKKQRKAPKSRKQK